MICPTCNEAHVRWLGADEYPTAWTCDHCGGSGTDDLDDDPCPSTSPSGLGCERKAHADHDHLAIVGGIHVHWFA